jgi:DNA topoisomerase III
MRVVVAEKPSVGRDLGRVLGATRSSRGYLEGHGLRITWCVGHMAELEEPAHYDAAWKRWSLDTLPMVPERFEIRARANAEDQLAVLRRLLADPQTTEVVNACDAGREGELIFRWVMELCRCSRPSLRLWTSSLTDAAIRSAWSKLSPASAWDRLGAAARCRAEADWLVGLNATRALTCRAREVGSSQLLSVGRVQTPTLAMIVARDREIAAFVPETYFRVEVAFEAEAGTFSARWFRPEAARTEADGPAAEERDGDAPHAERLADRGTAERLAACVTGRTGAVERAERKRTRERPPLLYDLTSLQRRANQRYGLSAARTLEVAQALYEKHKLITYPRTDSRFLTDDQVAGLPQMLQGLEPIGPYSAFVQGLLAQPQRLAHPGPRVVNPAEVGDHPAILPTGRTPPSDLGPDEKRVFDLVARRLLAALSTDALFDQTRLVVAVEVDEAALAVIRGDTSEPLGGPLRFRTQGRVCADPGWRAIDPPGASQELDLPAVNVGDAAQATDARAVEGQTRPPRHYNDASVLRSMETAGKALDDEALARALRGAGLGTPATRAAVLQTLLDRGYVERRGRELHATDKGGALIDAIPVDALKSAELTASWEGRLAEMADGRGPAREAFMDQVADHVREIVTALGAAPPPALAADPARDPGDAPVLGACPRCGQPVRARGPVFTCDTGRACPFVVFEKMAKRKIGVRAVKQLLKEGRTPVIKGFKSKAGRTFDAGLRWDEEAGKVAFWFPDRADEPEPTRAVPPPAREGDPCPTCGEGAIIAGRTALGCSRWREGCSFRAAMPAAGTGDPHTGIPSPSPRRGGAPARQPPGPARTGEGPQ